MTMYSKIDSMDPDKKGKHIENFLSSPLVKFIFLITQYASGKMTKNEPLVANSITIPPEETKNYYEFFGLTEAHKSFIEKTLEEYYEATKPKNKTRKGKKSISESETRKTHCPKTKELHPITKECVSKCNNKKVRNAKTGRCTKLKQGGRFTYKRK